MQVKINKRSAYAPIRYEATRPFAPGIGKSFITQARRGQEARLAFISTLIPLLKTAVNKLGSEQGPGPVQAEVLNVQIFGGFQDAGKVIFDVAAGLTSCLRLTDADAIPCGELPLPANAFYVHFGSHSGLMTDGYEIEGAFVDYSEGRLGVDLVPVGWGQPHFFALPMGEPLVGVSIDMSDPTKAIPDALSQSIDLIVKKNLEMLAQIAELEAQLSAQYGQLVKVPLPTERLDDKKPLLTKALSLIVNVMFYLAAEPTDVHEAWGRDTPSEALIKLKNANALGETKTIENTLLKAGYRKVRFVGGKFADSVASRAINEAVGNGRSLATHFRRGHFKRQPHGPENSLRKTIFVAPVVVNPDKGGDQLGRIYDVR